MFTCAECKKAIGPRLKPVTQVMVERAQSYHNVKVVKDEYTSTTVEINSEGFEIERERKICHECAGIQPTVDAPKVIIMGGKVFEEPMPKPFRLPLATIAIQSALDRNEHNSKRAKRDFATAVPLIKAFLDRNQGVRV